MLVPEPDTGLPDSTEDLTGRLSPTCSDIRRTQQSNCLLLRISPTLAPGTMLQLEMSRLYIAMHLGWSQTADVWVSIDI